MKTVLTVFKKEVIDTVRDRRTIIIMVLIPMMIFPLIITVMTKITASQTEKARAENLRVAIVDADPIFGFEEIIAQHDDILLVENVHADSVSSLVNRDSLDGAFVFSRFFSRRIENLEAGRIEFYYRSTEDRGIKKRRMKDLINELEKEILAARFKRLDLSEKIVNAINVSEVDITSSQEKMGKAVGAFLPYIFVIFCFMGSMYPAIDLAAGEKERGTLETLLTTPVDRFQILLGKLGVVSLTGTCTALVSLIGLYLGVRLGTELPPEMIEFLLSVLQFKSVALLLSLLIPLTIFFAGVLLSLSMFAKSFKEAQSIMTPANFLVVIPIVIGLIPGITLDAKTALIPVLNVSLATKEIVAGTINYSLLIEVYASLLALAGAALFVSSKLFGKESVIFRT